MASCGLMLAPPLYDVCVHFCITLTSPRKHCWTSRTSLDEGHEREGDEEEQREEEEDEDASG